MVAYNVGNYNVNLTSTVRCISEEKTRISVPLWDAERDYRYSVSQVVTPDISSYSRELILKTEILQQQPFSKTNISFYVKEESLFANTFLPRLLQCMAFV